jgi:TRAP-type mannitol/chloroaromatic compound transport system substrate-binding protein
VQALSWRYAGLEAYESAEAFRKMEEKGVKMTRLDDASLKKMKEAADQVIAEYAGKNPIFKEIWQNRVNFTKDYERMWKFAHMPSFE